MCPSQFIEVSPLREGDLFYYIDKEVKPGECVCYKVAPIWEKSEFGLPSNTFCFDFLYLPPPPKNISIKEKGGSVIISWEEREKISGYNIYKWREGSKEPRIPFNKVIIRGNKFMDTVTQGRYRYCITSVFIEKGIIYEGPCSKTVTIEVKRLLPPPPPIKVIGISHEGGVFLTWSPGGEGNYSYKVYKSEDGINFIEVTEKPIGKQFYMDKNVEKGKTYYYRLKAFYRGREDLGSLFSKTVEVKVE